MQRRKILLHTAILSCFLCCSALSQPTRTQAGCGCEKPPPGPSAVLQRAAFPGMPITLLYDGFWVGETWTVAFQSGGETSEVSATVVSRRDLTDRSGMSTRPQLIVTVPELSKGPASITAYTDADSFVVPADSFTIIAQPAVVSESEHTYEIEQYTTAVAQDGTVYFSLSGLENVCNAMRFRVRTAELPLRIDDVAIFNSQGFFIDSLGPITADFFFVEAQDYEDNSDLVHYFRHSFTRYCEEHLPGGVSELDPSDANWHLDGTPHVDYSTLILAISGHFDDGSVPQAGSVFCGTASVETEVGLGIEEWEREWFEEAVTEPDP